MFDTTRFLRDRFQKRSDVSRLVAGYGFPAPRPETLEKWWQRDRIPTAWFALIVALLELEHGKPISLAPYVVFEGRRHG